jgi:nudix-type nucleoside diphosphatase (YffH/AdpP family)
MGFEIRDSETRYRGYATIMAVTLATPGGETMVREVEDHGHAACVLPYDPERRTVLLVRLPRAPVILAGGPAQLLEAPAGMVENDPPGATVRREALEEVGVRLASLEPLGAPFSSPGVSTERIALYLAPYAQADRVAAGGGSPAEQEHITVVEMPLDEFWRAVDAGVIEDLKTLALGYALRCHHPELF